MVVAINEEAEAEPIIRAQLEKQAAKERKAAKMAGRWAEYDARKAAPGVVDADVSAPPRGNAEKAVD